MIKPRAWQLPLAIVALVTATFAAQAPVRGNHVVVISLDGFPGWALDDPYLPAPTLRRLAREGAAAKFMRPVDPTVTWANHTSMVTGVSPAKHGVIFNGLLIREPRMPPRVEPWRDKKEMVHARTVYDAAYERGLTTAQVDWVAIQNPGTITWEFAERPNPSNQIARELVKTGVISQPDLEAFYTKNILYRDHIWTMAAAHIIRRHRPNLMLFHLLNLDSTHHRYGPRSPAGMTAMTLLDNQVETIVKAVQDAGIAATTTFFIVSDHGFKLVKRQIRPNVAFARAGLLKVVNGKVTEAEAYSYPEGGTALIYVTVPDESGVVLKRVKAALAELEGVDAVIEPADFGKYGLPQPTPTSQMGVLLLSGKEGYAFTADATEPAVVDAPAGSLGSHGYLANDPDLRALFIASGRGIKRGTTIESVSNLDLAPTIAQLLGVELKDVEGKVLTPILAVPAKTESR